MDRLWQLKFWALIAALIGLALGLTVVFFHTNLNYLSGISDRAAVNAARV